jgi:hypothetical protein
VKLHLVVHSTNHRAEAVLLGSGGSRFDQI